MEFTVPILYLALEGVVVGHGLDDVLTQSSNTPRTARLKMFRPYGG